VSEKVKEKNAHVGMERKRRRVSLSSQLSVAWYEAERVLKNGKLTPKYIQKSIFFLLPKRVLFRNLGCSGVSVG